MDDYLIRPVEQRDVERALGIISRHDESIEDQAREFFKVYFDEPIRDSKTGRHYVTEIDNELVAIGGYVGCDQKDVYWIGFLFVDPYYQGQRLGSNLIKRIEENISSINGKYLYVAVSQEDLQDQSVKFFEANKFFATGEKQNPPFKMTDEIFVYQKKIG